jgi:hypothetical protein
MKGLKKDGFNPGKDSLVQVDMLKTAQALDN